MQKKTYEKTKYIPFTWICIILILFPPVLDVIFGIVNIPVPAYLFAIGLSIIILATAISNYIYKADFYSLRIFSFLIFFIWIICGKLYSISTNYVDEKNLSISYLILAPVIVIICSNYFLGNFTNATSYFEKKAELASKVMIVFFVFTLLFFHDVSFGRIVLPGLNNPIWLTRHIGMLVLILFYSLFEKGKIRFNFMLFIITGLICMLIVGSRTPVISLLFCILILRFKHHSLFKNVFFIFIFVVLGYIASVFFSDSYVFDTDFYSLYERFEYLVFVNTSDFDSLIGIGTGGFGVFFSRFDERIYPHNIFLEIFVENGLIGLVLFLIPLIFYLWKAKLDLIKILVVYTFVNTLTSGDIPGNNVFFLLLFVGLLKDWSGNIDLKKMKNKK